MGGMDGAPVSAIKSESTSILADFGAINSEIFVVLQPNGRFTFKRSFCDLFFFKTFYGDRGRPKVHGGAQTLFSPPNRRYILFLSICC